MSSAPGDGADVRPPVGSSADDSSAAVGPAVLRGRAWVFGDDISTDHIAPGRLFHLRTDLPELAKHVHGRRRPVVRLLHAARRHRRRRAAISAWAPAASTRRASSSWPG